MSDEPETETEQAAPEGLEDAIDAATEAVAVQANALEEFDPAQAGSDAPMGLPHLMNVPVEITVEVGRTRMTLAELVNLGPGSLVELDREAHEPADVLVNGRVVARGEIVTIGEGYGVRISEVKQQ